MRVMHAFAVAVAMAAVVPVARGVAQGMDPDRQVPNGGITVTGWQGKIDKASVGQGRTINDSKFAPMGADGFQLNIGPAAVYWNPANTASGDFTVTAKFVEPKYMSANSHPHPYGVFIGGHQMGTDKMSLIYCTAYGDGSGLVRGFSADAKNGRGMVTGVFQPMAKTANPAVAKAAADGSVTQTISWTVKGDTAACTINGTQVASYGKADVIAPDKLEGFDGIVGIRVSHNLDVNVSGFAIKK